MPRPRFAPGSLAVFPVKNRSGKKSLAAYLGSRLGVVEDWAADLIARGCVTLDGTAAKAGDSINLSAGPHRIEVRFPETWPRHMAATDMPLTILHEDHDLVVLDKPPGVVVHPARGHLDNLTLQNGVRYRYRHRLGLEETTIGPPHRLDKDTSGVVVFALTRTAYVNLVAQFSRAVPHKRYLAVLEGRPAFAELVCTEPIGMDPRIKGKGAVVPVGEGGKTARTDFRILERGDGWALAEAVPHTGRPHQIRVHAMHLGLPLAGDRVYNPNPERLPFPRQALHAAELGFIHPITGNTITITAALAADMVDAMGRLRSRE